MKHIALITGASSGLGREFARLLAREAVDELWLVARRGERLRELSAELAVPCRIFALDLTQEAALEELSAALSAEPPVVRYLVNAAGFGRIGMAADIGAATTGRMIALNCRALAAEVAARGITVTAICPYWIRDTEFIHEAKKTDRRGLFRGFSLATDQKTVARRSLWAAAHGFTVFTPDLVSTLHRIVTSILPHRLMIALSNLWRHLAG